jgi:hypothetical protein
MDSGNRYDLDRDAVPTLFPPSRISAKGIFEGTAGTGDLIDLLSLVTQIFGWLLKAIAFIAQLIVYPF